MTGPPPSDAGLILEPEAIQGDHSQAARFIRGFLEAGTGRLVTNARSRVGLATYGQLRLPVTVEDGRYGDTYVASPHSAYVLYARDEIDILGLTGLAKTGAQMSLAALDRWLRALAINRTVHIDNWMFSTSLHGRWDGTGLAAMRRAVTEAFPDHLPVVRCVDPWSCPALVSSLKSDGWSLLPSRQIWVTDDLEGRWHPRSHTKSDRRAMRRSSLVVEELEVMSDADAGRLADLYAQLYLGRYSALNPAYTPAFVKHACDSGALRFRVARDAKGVIMASAGMRVAGDLVTVPMLGYDTTRPKSEALYRIASLLSSEWAMERGYRHHGSSGAGEFKSNRGARGQIEYLAVHASHWPRGRRMGLRLLAEILERTMVPALKQQGW